jgi:hypothetical protein
MQLNRYRLYCVTEGAYTYSWDEQEPVVCPNDGAHSINTDLTIIIDEAVDYRASNILDDQIEGITRAGLTKSIISGRSSNGKYNNVNVTVDKQLEVAITNPVSSFGSIKISQTTPCIQLTFPYNLNSKLLEYSGKVSQNDSLAILTVENLQEESILSSKRRVRCYPGKGIVAIISVIFDTNKTNIKQLAGLGYKEDGFYIGSNGASFGVFRIKGGVEYFFPQNSWNNDALDGYGESGIVLDQTKGNVFQIEYQCVSFGMVTFSIEDPESGNFIVFHRLKYPNLSTEPIINTLTFPITAYIVNKGNYIDSGVIKIGDSSLSVDGIIERTGPVLHTSNTISKVSTLEEHLLTLRNKNKINGAPNRSIVFILEIQACNDHTKPSEITIYKNVNLKDTLFISESSEGSSIVEYSYTGTIVTSGINVEYRNYGFIVDSGEKIIGSYIGGESTTVINTKLYDIQLYPGESLTVTARATQSKNAIVSCGITWGEDL